MFILSVFDGDHLIQRKQLPYGNITVGSARSSDIQLDGLSPFEFAIHVTPEEADISRVSVGLSELEVASVGKSASIRSQNFHFRIDFVEAISVDTYAIQPLVPVKDQILLVHSGEQRIAAIPFGRKKEIDLMIDDKKVTFKRSPQDPVDKVYKVGAFQIYHKSLPRSEFIKKNKPLEQEQILPFLAALAFTFLLLFSIHHFHDPNPSADDVIAKLAVESQQTVTLEKPKPPKQEKPPEPIEQPKVKADAAQAFSLNTSTPAKPAPQTAKRDMRAQKQGAKIQSLLGRVTKTLQVSSRKVPTASGSTKSESMAIASLSGAAGNESVGVEFKDESLPVGIEARQGGGEGRMAASVGGVGAANALSLNIAESKVSGGLDRDLVNSIIKSHLGRILHCYERNLSSDPTLKGKLKVRFEIGNTGSVIAKSVTEKSLNSERVESCVLQQVGTWKFPKPEGGVSVVVTYPFLFSKTGDGK